MQDIHTLLMEIKNPLFVFKILFNTESLSVFFLTLQMPPIDTIITLLECIDNKITEVV